MAFGATSPAAFALKIVFDGIPVPRMGIHLQTRTAAVTGDADVALVMTGLAGAQISTCLDGMVAGPLMAEQQTAGMTILALGRRKIAVIRADAGKRTIPELPAVRLELAVFVLELGMAGSAVFRIMATVATLGAALGFQGMELQEIVPVTPGHIVA